MDDIEGFIKPIGTKALEVFKTRILQDAVLLDVIKDKNILHHLTLLIEATNRSIFNLSNPSPNEKQNERNDITKKTKRWLAIFAAGFKKITGTDLLQTANGKSIRMIQETIYKLEEKGADAEIYLTYLFDDFFMDSKNETFKPPQLLFTTSNFALERFFVAYKEVIDKKKAENQKAVEMTDIYNRYRVLIRSNTDNKEKINELKLLCESFKKGDIDLKEWKEKIIMFEKTS